MNFRFWYDAGPLVIISLGIVGLSLWGVQHERHRAQAIHSVTEKDSRVWVYQYDGKTYLVNRDGGVIEHKKVE